MSSDDVCTERKINHVRVRTVRDNLISNEAIDRLADTFKVLADPTRIKIVFSLLHGELCVCEIVEIVGMSQSAVSHQLRKLKDMRIVKRRKSAKMVYYSLDDDHILRLLTDCADHVAEETNEPVVIPSVQDLV